MIDINNINVLALAYLGDSVYEVYIREYLIEMGIVDVNKLQQEATLYVSAKGQVYFLNKLIENNILSEKEINIIHRGRNHKSHKSPKNTDVNTYKWSTGFETLIGYLYLDGNKRRIEEIINYIKECD